MAAIDEGDRGTTSIGAKAVRGMISERLMRVGIKVVDVQTRDRDIHIWVTDPDDSGRVEEALSLGFMIDMGLVDCRPIVHVISKSWRA